MAKDYLKNIFLCLKPTIAIWSNQNANDWNFVFLDWFLFGQLAFFQLKNFEFCGLFQNIKGPIAKYDILESSYGQYIEQITFEKKVERKLVEKLC
jgi:hypothetical protein